MSKIEYRIDDCDGAINVVAIEYRPVAEVIGTFSSRAHAERFMQTLGESREPALGECASDGASPKKRHRKDAWTPEEDALLRKLNAAGWLPHQMAEHLPKRTVRAISLRRYTIGLRANGRRPYPASNGHAAEAAE